MSNYFQQQFLGLLKAGLAIFGSRTWGAEPPQISKRELHPIYPPECQLFLRLSIASFLIPYKTCKARIVFRGTDLNKVSFNSIVKPLAKGQNVLPGCRSFLGTPCVSADQLMPGVVPGLLCCVPLTACLPGAPLTYFNDGGCDRVSYFIPKKIPTSEFVYSQKSLLFFSIP